MHIYLQVLCCKFPSKIDEVEAENLLTVVLLCLPKEMLYVYSCDWNYRPDHCMYMHICDGAVKNGVSVLHGSRRVWFNDKQPAFKAIYNAFKVVSKWECIGNQVVQ